MSTQLESGYIISCYGMNISVDGKFGRNTFLVKTCS